MDGGKRQVGQGRQVFLHFGGTISIALMLFVVCSALMYFAFGRYDATDEAVYQQLVYGDSDKLSETTKSVQHRTGLRKDVFFSDKGQPQRLTLESAEGELVLVKQDGSAEVVEHMHDVTCQLLKGDEHVSIQAADASYYYKDERFIADTVTMERYIDPQDIITMKAGHVEYDGKEAALSQTVHVRHHLGEVTADAMVADTSKRPEGSLFDDLQMTGNVRVDMSDGGRLLCDRASLDAKRLQGVFFSGPTQSYVVYTAGDRSENTKKGPLVVRSRKMDAKLLSESKKLHIGDLTANGDVSVTYNGDFVAESDHAVFSRGADMTGGTITMLPENPGAQCKVTNASGDVIHASKINVDVNTKNLVFIDANGMITNVGKQPEKIQFSSKKLIWNNALESLTLSGEASIEQKGIGKLHAAKEIVIKMRTVDGKKVAREIGTQGDVELIYTDKDLYLDHKLKCYGTLKVDHQKMESRLQSPKDIFGDVIADRQIFFEDSKGNIYADRAYIKYEQVDNALVPVRVVLEGNVKITNLLAFSEKDQTPVKQYVLADRVDFLPRTKEMIFKGSKEQHVLLFDQANDLQVSAPGIKVIRDMATKKETFEGLGDVRMNFAEKEFQRIRSHFSLSEAEKNKE